MVCGNAKNSQFTARVPSLPVLSSPVRNSPSCGLIADGCEAVSDVRAEWAKTAREAMALHYLDLMSAARSRVTGRVATGVAALLVVTLVFGPRVGSRWRAAGMLEAGKQFRPVNGHLHLPALRAALAPTRRRNWRPKPQNETVNAA